MKNILLNLLIGATILTFAEVTLAGDGTKGGDNVKIEGRTRLRDLVDNSNCLWVHTDQFVNDVPAFDGILKKLENTHWYFAHALRQESRSTGICKIDGSIKDITTEDLNGLTYYQLPGKKSQMAIRLNDDIYLSMAGFKKGPGAMPEEDQGYGVVHELMHSFIPDDTYMRNIKVRSMTAVIQSNLPTESFKYQMEKNNLEVHRYLPDLEPYKEDILRMGDPSLSYNERAISARKVMPIQNILYAGDQKVIQDLLNSKSQEEADNKLSNVVVNIKNEAEYYKFASLYPNLKIFGQSNFVEIAMSRGWGDLGFKIINDRKAVGIWTAQDYRSAIAQAIIADIPETIKALYKDSKTPLNSILNWNLNGLQISAYFQSLKTLNLFLKQSQITVNDLGLVTLALGSDGQKSETNLEVLRTILNCPKLDLTKENEAPGIKALLAQNTNPNLNRQIVKELCAKRKYSDEQCLATYRPEQRR